MNSVQPYIILNLLTVLIALFVALVSWKRRKTQGGFALFFLMLAVAQWAFFSAFEVGASTIPQKIFWSKVAYIGTLSSPVLFLFLALDYTGKKEWLSKRNILLFFIVPIITFFVAITNESHHQIWTSFTPHPANEHIIQYGHGVYFWFGVIGYSYLCVMSGTLLLIQSAIRMAHTYRMQSIALLIASIIPWTGNIIYVSGLNPFPGIDLTPIAFSFTGIVSAYAIFRFYLLDLVPVARGILIETMFDGVIVLDRKNRIIDINPSGLNFIGGKPSDSKTIIGKTIKEILGEKLESLGHMDLSKTYHMQIQWDESQDVFTDVNFIPIIDKRDVPTGRLIVLRDISEQKRIETELQQANDKLQSQLFEISKLQDNLREQAFRDPLTGLYNRRFLNEVLEFELSRAIRENTPLSLVMLDLDFFKDFNDTHGHTAGDDMLKKLGDILRKNTRQGDFACRYGGEEFVVVMPGAPLHAALKRAEEWREDYAQSYIPNGGTLLQNTFSAGVASYPDHAEDMGGLLKSVDKALYQAKSSGRNRVEEAKPSS